MENSSYVKDREKYAQDSERYNYILDYFKDNQDRVLDNVDYLEDLNRLLLKNSYKELSKELTGLLSKTLGGKVGTFLDENDLRALGRLYERLNIIKTKRLKEGKEA